MNKMAKDKNLIGFNLEYFMFGPDWKRHMEKCNAYNLTLFTCEWNGCTKVVSIQKYGIKQRGQTSCFS